MDELRTSVQNASYEQKDPLLIYKLESFNLFKAMMEQINRGVVSTLMKGQIPISEADEVKEAPLARRSHDRSQYREEKMDADSSGEQHEEPESAATDTSRTKSRPERTMSLRQWQEV